jgi:hypothetical protein
MNHIFNLNHDRLAALPRGAEIAEALDAFGPIDSPDSFNRYCRAACRVWRDKFPEGRGGTSPHFAELLSHIAQGADEVIRRGWGGVVITRHEHPDVEKYLVVRQDGYLALEKHELKDERLEVKEGAGMILWRQPNEEVLTVEGLRPDAEFHLKPGMEHCLIGTENLLVFERSIDPKGMDQDLIFIYEPDGSEVAPSHA